MMSHMTDNAEVCLIRKGLLMMWKGQITSDKEKIRLRWIFWEAGELHKVRGGEFSSYYIELYRKLEYYEREELIYGRRNLKKYVKL